MPMTWIRSPARTMNLGRRLPDGQLERSRRCRSTVSVTGEPELVTLDDGRVARSRDGHEVQALSACPALRPRGPRSR